MRECIEAGDVKEVTSEANVRLNVWLRAVSPSKRIPGRNRGFDQGSWGRQSRNATNSNFRNISKTGDRWQGKNLVMEEGSSGDQWRKKCQLPVQRKIEGRIGSSNSCMASDKGINEVNKKDVYGVKESGGDIKIIGGRQKELVKTNENHCKRVSGVNDTLTTLINKCDSKVVMGLPSSIGSVTIGLPVGPLTSPEPMSLEKVGDQNKFKDLGSNLCPSRTTLKSYKLVKWKRLAREKLTTDDAADLGKKKTRDEMVGGIVKEDSSSSRKRDGGALVTDAITDRKKKKAILLADSAVAAVLRESAASLAEPAAGCMESNKQSVAVNVSPKSVIVNMVSLDKEAELEEVNQEGPEIEDARSTTTEVEKLYQTTED
ncbi:hypothetical protein LWI29_012332 [Acer saccharum]|uniref:Uncharacterized protein n=1 Tax=Acer saccharum TaxID=4024 RepID=A0AA39V974_ACESA|nr:hypothetical protein LWI29_012332 [Acer saccharum]